jgi:hypothetical protein
MRQQKSVLAVDVVPLSSAHLTEAQLGVQLDRGRVALPNLQMHPQRTVGVQSVDKTRGQTTADACPARVERNRHRQHLRLVRHDATERNTTHARPHLFAGQHRCGKRDPAIARGVAPVDRRPERRATARGERSCRIRVLGSERPDPDVRP